MWGDHIGDSYGAGGLGLTGIGEGGGGRGEGIGLGTIGTIGHGSGTGTASASSDYTPTSGTLSFAAGKTAATLQIALTNDTLNEADETVNLVLSSPTGGAELGDRPTAVLTILDDE